MKPKGPILRWVGAVFAVICAAVSLCEGGLGILGAVVLLAAAFMISPLSKSVPLLETHSIPTVIAAGVLWFAGMAMLGFATPETVDDNTRSIPISSETEDQSKATDTTASSIETKESKTENTVETTNSADTDKSVTTNSSEKISNTASQVKTTEKETSSESEQIVTEKEKHEYVLNKNSMVFHYPDCPSVKTMSDKNKSEVTANRDDLIKKGYDPCGNCHP